MQNEIQKRGASKRNGSKGAPRAGSKGPGGPANPKGVAQIYNVGGKGGSHMNSKQQIIKRGKQDAENLSNFMPLFQKKVRDPTKVANAVQSTSKYDYSRQADHQVRA